MFVFETDTTGLVKIHMRNSVIHSKVHLGTFRHIRFPMKEGVRSAVGLCLDQRGHWKDVA